MYHYLSVHSAPDGHLGCFQFLQNTHFWEKKKASICHTFLGVSKDFKLRKYKLECEEGIV